MYAFMIKQRAVLLIFLTHHMALPILKLVRSPEKFPYAAKDLQNFSDGTLGKDLVKFLDTKNLQLLTFYARHDMKHILLDYDASEEGEGQLQCFMLGNGHFSFPVAATVIYCFATMLEYWVSFRKAFNRGRKAVAICHWNWVEILSQPTQELKNRINQNIIE